MLSRVYETIVRPSVRLSVCLSQNPTAAAAFGEIAAERRAGRIYQLTAAAQGAAGAGRLPAAAPQLDAQQQMRAVSRLQPT